MICRDVRPLIQPYCDGELDLVRHVAIEQHLAECSECGAQKLKLQSLRAAISSPSLYYRAPDSFRARMQPAVPSIAQGRLSLSQWVSVAVGILLMIGTSATIGVMFSGRGPSADERLAEWVVADHIRSFQVDHLTDVESSDRHTVKPWFQGKLDFAPKVADLSSQEYRLSGGRMDYLADHPVAALVYFRRLHAINVFSWPALDDRETAVRRLTRQGFHLRHWQQSGMTYWAISDLNDQELDEFVQHFQNASPQKGP